MKFLLKGFIKIYWLCWAEKERRHCLFAKSCSKHVYKITDEKGFIAGLKAFKDRYFKCRPGYKIFPQNGELYVKLADGSVIKEEKASPRIIAPYNKSVKVFEDSLNS